MVVARETSTKILATGSDPAAGNEATVTLGAVGDGYVYHIKAIYIPFVTSATAANRVPEIQITDENDNPVFTNAASTAITASSSVAVQAQRVDSNFTTGSGDEVVVLPEGMIVPGGYKVQTSTGAIEADDDYGAPIVFGSWFDGY